MKYLINCPGGKCPLKSSCYRYLMKEELKDEDSFRSSPFETNDGGASCKFYVDFLEEDSVISGE